MRLSIISILITVTFMHAQDKDSELKLPVNLQSAYESGTRSLDGKPGPRYWQNKANYDIHVHFDPATRLLSGSEKIKYYNQSPDTLSKLIFHLFPDLYKKGYPRDFIVDPEDLTEGVTIEHFIVNEDSVSIKGPLSPVSFTPSQMIIQLGKPILPDTETQVEIEWSYTLNKGSHMRTGGVHEGSFFIAYFFPRIAVYDDIDGWNEFAYTGNIEFYNDFGDFKLSVSVPQNFIVWATGLLNNPEAVLKDKYLNKYRKAMYSESIVQIVDSSECLSKDITAQNLENIWIFVAENVNDAAFAISDHYLWDGCSIIVDPASGKRTYLDVAYDRYSLDFYEVTVIARKAIEYMSTEHPGYPFPFPAITIFDGSDGMEYPMMVNNTSQSQRDETVKLTVHEVLHSYQPFLTGMNETKYAWMDEGLTSFGDYIISQAIDTPNRRRYYYLDSYLDKTGMDLELPLFVISRYLRKPVYTFNSYPKAAGFFMTLYDLLGEIKYKKAFQLFIDRWKYKHPTPYDFFYTFEDITGQPLAWLIQPWFFEFAHVDLELTRTEDMIKKPSSIEIHNKGGLPVPIHLKVNYTNGDELILKQPASVWEHCKDRVALDIPQHKKINSVELLNPTLIDADIAGHLLTF